MLLNPKVCPAMLVAGTVPSGTRMVRPRVVSSISRGGNQKTFQFGVVVRLQRVRPRFENVRWCEVG
jgi:hypothetical protein